MDYTNALEGPLNMITVAKDCKKYVGAPIYHHENEEIVLFSHCTVLGTRWAPEQNRYVHIWEFAGRRTLFGAPTTFEIETDVDGLATTPISASPILSPFKYVGLGLKAFLDQEDEKKKREDERKERSL